MRANIVGPLDVATRSAPPLQVAIPSLVLGLWKLGYVGAGILKSDKPATARQRYRLVKAAGP